MSQSFAFLYYGYPNKHSEAIKQSIYNAAEQNDDFMEEDDLDKHLQKEFGVELFHPYSAREPILVLALKDTVIEGCEGDSEKVDVTKLVVPEDAGDRLKKAAAYFKIKSPGKPGWYLSAGID